MPLEAASFIQQLDPGNPVGGLDDYSTADDHLRMIKSVLRNQFPNFENLQVLASVAELNLLQGQGQGFARWQRKFKTTDEIVNNSNGFQLDNELNGFQLVAGGYYAFDIFLSTTAPVAGLKTALEFSNAPQTLFWQYHLIVNGSLGSFDAGAALSQFYIPASSAKIHLVGAFQANGALGGSLDLHWAQSTPTVENSTFFKGSWFKLERLD